MVRLVVEIEGRLEERILAEIDNPDSPEKNKTQIVRTALYDFLRNREAAHKYRLKESGNE